MPGHGHPARDDRGRRNPGVQLTQGQLRVGHQGEEHHQGRDGIRARAERGQDDGAVLLAGDGRLDGDRQIEIAAGEAQLIAIIRLALKNPALVLLDEMTARLDSAMESTVLAAIEALCKGRTVLAIAHKAKAMAWMDRTIYLENGRIVDESNSKGSNS